MREAKLYPMFDLCQCPSERERLVWFIFNAEETLPMSAQKYVRWFHEIRLEDVPLVGGKNASLGELYSTLASEGVRVPNGFALTAQAYRDALAAADAINEPPSAP